MHGLIEGRMDEGYKDLKKTTTQLMEVEYLFYLYCVKHWYFKEVDKNTIFFPFLSQEE